MFYNELAFITTLRAETFKDWNKERLCYKRVFTMHIKYTLCIQEKNQSRIVILIVNSCSTMHAIQKKSLTLTYFFYRCLRLDRAILSSSCLRLNLDYKIASKVIARRLEKVLALLINPDQTGFIKGRYIGQNIRLINDILEQTKLQNVPGILLQLDFRKAFDTIEWELIQRTIALFNFGESIQRWISTFYSNTESAVLNNGFCTNYFHLSRGVRQGCPLSPYLFVLAVELLACKIKQDKEMQGIKIFGKELKLSQFADDTTLLNSNCNSVKKSNRCTRQLW